MFGIEFLPQAISEDMECLKAMIQGARENLGQEVDFVLIPSNPINKASISSLLGAYALRERFSMIVDSRFGSVVEFVPTISGAGLDRLQIQSQILGVKYGGFSSVALIGGDNGELDGVKLIALAREILGGEVSLVSGSGLKIWEKEIEQRLTQKLQAGVDRIITQPVFSMESAKKCVEHFYVLQERLGIQAKLSLGVFGIFSAESAYRINESGLGFEIPRAYLKALEQGKVKETFISLWQDMQGLIKEYREYDVSLYLSTPKHNDLRAYRMGQSKTSHIRVVSKEIL
ncbi:methylenetetrahydrofolate reductase [uncultured Helicobacter sp.]|uniref:methylenetetrahydrofolate reductase n=1 Tax=uncultured Helicobacter sp. TaxID=175537 RepID=UPI00260048D0|nr:methylenetetrahydrofolate reductase [uncultured Helicobacter sp.]